MATRASLVDRINRNLGNTGNVRFSTTRVNSVFQKGYNWATALTGAIQRSTPFPFPSDTPYINLRQYIPDFFAVLGIYNLRTNRWLTGTTPKILNSFRWDWERWVGGAAEYYFVLDFNRVGIVPYETVGTGTFLLWYLAKAQTLGNSTPIELPNTFAGNLADYTTGELLDVDREYVKAETYLGPFYEDIPKIQRLINNLASYDKNHVLEPYLPMQRYGNASTGESTVSFVDNIIPAGTVDGTNDTFTLPSTPNPGASLFLLVNGLMAYSGTAYNLSGSTIVFEPDYIPQPNYLLRAWYRIS